MNETIEPLLYLRHFENGESLSEAEVEFIIMASVRSVVSEVLT